MSLFRPERRTDYPTSNLSELYRRREMPTSAGAFVTKESAKRNSTVWACIDLIATLVSTLPLDEFRQRMDQPRIEVELGDLFTQPDGNLELDAWIYQIIESLLTVGNAYGLILSRDRDGWPTRIQMLSASDVTVSQRGAPLGPWEFKLTGTPIRRYDPLSGMGDLWHLPAFMVPGSILGLSVISHAANTIGLALAAQDFAAEWFRDNATPAAILSNQKEVNKSTAELVKSRWMASQANNREPTVLGDDWKYQPISVPANESQFLETIQATNADIARFFRVPVFELDIALQGSSKTYANIEQRAIALLTYTLNPWLVRLERAFSGFRPRGRVVKFNVDALLRTDLMTRYKAHDLAIRDGWRSPDEVRAIEDLAPLPAGEGDKFLWPPWRSQLTEDELGTGDEIVGGVDNADEDEESEDDEATEEGADDA